MWCGSTACRVRAAWATRRPSAASRKRAGSRSTARSSRHKNAKKNGTARGRPVSISAKFRFSDDEYVRGLQPLRATRHFEFDLSAFGERLETLALDRAEVDEHVFAGFSRDEAESLRVVEPLDGTGCLHGCLSPFCCAARSERSLANNGIGKRNGRGARVIPPGASRGHVVVEMHDQLVA